MAGGSTKKEKSQLRNRKRKTKDADSDSDSKKDSTPSKEGDPSSEMASETNENSWKIIRRHPLFWGFVFLGIPYVTYFAFRWVVLQHPFLPGMRPAVTLGDPRQVLILGSMSSGTSSIADDLRRNQILEVGHEDTDTNWKFVRDGTVSWFHGIRYVPTNDQADKVCRIISTFRIIQYYEV